MKIKSLLISSASALVLTGAGAFADNNEAFLLQSGATNSALIDQSASSEGRAGRSGQAITQNGDNNTLTLTQTGSNSRFGANNVTPASAGAVIQTGSRNVLNAEQNGLRNGTLFVYQTSSSGLAGPSNVATITQTGNYGGIGTVEQIATTSTAVMNTLTLQQSGGNSSKITNVLQNFTGASGDTGNTMAITQTGGTQGVGGATQIGSANDANIQQSNRSNRLDLAWQEGTGNSLIATMSGEFNGNVGGSPFATLAMFGSALDSGATANVLRSIGNANQINMTLSGNYNAYGVEQQGNENEALGIVVTGDDNAVGVGQFGDRNKIALGAVNGFRNSIGIRQDGDDNLADTDVIGDDNDTVTLQDGTFNEAYVTITGDFNGASSTGLFGVAAGVAGAQNGRVAQWGDFNMASLTIDGNNNAFSLAQGSALTPGSNNTIDGTVNGSDNAVAVSQGGNGNTANFSQVGGSNSAAIVQ